MRLLQLYKPWSQESDLKHEDGTYRSEYKQIENQTFENVKRHEPYLNTDYEELKSCNFLNLDNESDNKEFSMLNPRFNDFEEEKCENVLNKIYYYVHSTKKSSCFMLSRIIQ